MSLERRQRVIVVHPVIGLLRVRFDLLQELRMRGFMLPAPIMGQRIGRRPARHVAFALVRAAEVCLQMDTQCAKCPQVFFGGLGIVPGPEQPAALYLSTVAGSIAAKVTKVADALKRVDSLCHVMRGTAPRRNRPDGRRGRFCDPPLPLSCFR